MGWDEKYLALLFVEVMKPLLMIRVEVKQGE